MGSINEKGEVIRDTGTVKYPGSIDMYARNSDYLNGQIDELFIRLFEENKPKIKEVAKRINNTLTIEDFDDKGRTNRKRYDIVLSEKDTTLISSIKLRDVDSFYDRFRTRLATLRDNGVFVIDDIEGAEDIILRGDVVMDTAHVDGQYVCVCYYSYRIENRLMVKWMTPNHENNGGLYDKILSLLFKVKGVK